MSLNVPLAATVRSRKPYTVVWSQVSGPTASFDDTAILAPVVTLPSVGTYVFRLTVDDGEFVVTDDITINAVDNTAPVADAGSGGTYFEGESVQLYGSATDDGFPTDPGELSYTWSAVSAPMGGTATFTDVNDPATTVEFDLQGSYTLRLTVSDGDLSDTDDVSFTIDPFAGVGTVYATATPANSSVNGLPAELQVDLSRLDNTWWAETHTTGRDIRVTDNADNLLPFDLIDFNKSAKTGFLVFPKVINTSGNTAVKIWAGHPSITAPEPTDTIGRYNAYTGFTFAYWPHGSGEDRTRNQRHLTFLGGTPSLTPGPNGSSATDYSGAGQYARAAIAGGLPINTIFSVAARRLSSVGTFGGYAITANGTVNSGIRVCEVSRLANNNDYCQWVTSANKVYSHQAATSAGVDTWTIYSGGLTSTTGLRAAETGLSSSKIKGEAGSDRVTLGARANLTPVVFYDGEIAHGKLYGNLPTAFLGGLYVYDRAMLNQATFWGSWTTVTP